MRKQWLYFVLMVLTPLQGALSMTAYTLLEWQELYKLTAVLAFSAGRCGVPNEIDLKIQLLTAQAPLSDYEKNQLMVTYQRYRANGYAELAKDGQDGERLSSKFKGWKDNLQSYLCTSSNKKEIELKTKDLTEKLDELIAQTSVMINNLFSRIQEKQNDYQIRLHDLMEGYINCDIENVSVDQQAQKMIIDFRYRGITSVTLRAVSTTSLSATGSYPIDLPVLGASNVQVELLFKEDGTAQGQWKNRVLGKKYEGDFSIVKRR